MPLFNPKTVDAALKSFAFTPSERQSAAAKQWSELVRSSFIWRQKETALEADFNRYVVQDILGYRSMDASGMATLSVKQQVGPGEVDLALGHFGPEQTQIIAPFELKGPALENLDAIMPGRAKTPVQQAWEYANDAVDARWVIVSNQRVLRLYAVGRGRRDYEIFDLARLDEPGKLKRFVLILGAQNLLGNETLELLKRSLREDKDITDQLYKDYSKLRENLLQSIRNHHAEIPAEQAIGLAQKILDRVIFIAFAEDSVLLPNDSIRDAVAHENPYGEPQPKWETVKALFAAVDRGNPRLNIPPYNGGLFAPDAQLEALNIPDHICEQFAGIAAYDFQSQVSVTILGHIFEQSITDIEQKHAEVRGEVLPKATKRKREGVVYTPDFVTRFIVEHTIRVHLEERFNGLLEKHAIGSDAKGAIRWKSKGSEPQFWRDYLDAVTGLRVLDPACGSGAFLIAAFDFLKAEQTRVRERLAELEPGLLVHSAADSDIEIITSNLYGVDVNTESVEITKLSLWLKTAKRDRQLESLDQTIQCGNSLIEDSDFHHRAFEWRKAFPEIFAAGGFDIVIGNPPYVRMELIKPFKPYLERRYEVVADRADLYAYFFELGVRLLKPGGRLGYISSSTFFRTGSGEPLRRYLTGKAEIEAVVDFGDLQIFEGVTTYPTIVTMRRANGHSADALRFLKVEALPDDLSKKFSLSSQPMPRARLGTGSWRFESDSLDTIRRKMSAGRKMLSQVYGSPLRGIVSGLNEAFVINRQTRDALVSRDARSADLLKPFLVGENLKRWHVESDDLWLIYTPKNRVDIEEYPAIRDHLVPFRAALEKRATKQNWWELQQAQAAYQAAFEASKVIYCDISNSNTASVDRGHYLANTCYFVGSADAQLLAILNSRAFWFFVSGVSNIAQNGYIRLRSEFVGQMPIPGRPDAALTQLCRLAEASAQQRLECSRKFLARVADLRGGVPVAQVLSKWATLSFSKFRDELKRLHKIEVPLSERDEWESYFNARKAEVDVLSVRVVSAEKEINDRIYRLFDLSHDEIALIEDTLAGQN